MKIFCLLLVAVLACSGVTVKNADAASATKQGGKRKGHLTMKQATAHYLKLLPVDISRKIALDGMPNELRPTAEKVLTVAFFEEMVVKALEKHYTPEEIVAMADFFGSDVGKKAMMKYGDFLVEVSGAIQKKMNTVSSGVSRSQPGFTPIPQ